MRYPCSTRSSSIGSAVRTPHAGARACPQRRSAPRAHAPRHLPCMRALAARRSPLAAHTLPSLLRLRTLVPVAPQPFTRPAPAAAVTVAKAVAEPYVTAEEREEQRAMGCAPPQLKPFGGRIQLIFCGDFLQLPPVQARHTPTRPHTSSHTRTPAHTRTHPQLLPPAPRCSRVATRRRACATRRAANSSTASRTACGSAQPSRLSRASAGARPTSNPLVVQVATPWSRLQPLVVQAAVPCS